MVHRALEELVDTIMFLCGVLGLLIFFFIYWENSFQLRYTEMILRDFSGKIAGTGKVTMEEYEGLLQKIYKINSKSKLQMQCYQYIEQPMYTAASSQDLYQYFQKRNAIGLFLPEQYEPEVEQEPEEDLCFLTETNASILAAEKLDYLPLPSEKEEFIISAVRDTQEIYEDESLITLCKVLTQGMGCYVEGEAITAKKTGEQWLNVKLNDDEYKVPIQVICHPRTIMCGNGHKITNTKKIIEKRKRTGKIVCPYCAILPEQIICKNSEVMLKTGEELTKDRIGINVLYLDGSTEYITPESEDWQDSYDSNFCGKQLVTIRYRNAETKITVISENESCLQCKKECNDRSRKDYLNYPYCIDCLTKMLIFTGKTEIQERVIPEKELLVELETKQEFIFRRGDFLILEVNVGGRKAVVQRKVTIDGVSEKQ